MSDMAFEADSLDANRSGQLSSQQLQSLQAGLKRKHGGISGMIGRQFDPLAKDVAEPSVETVDGAINKSHNPRWRGDTFMPHIRITIANPETGSQEYAVPRDIYEWAPRVGMVRAYYLPQSRMLVNLERLPDAPVDYTPEGAESTVRAYAEASTQHDKVGRIEALAGMDALNRQMHGEASSDAPPDDRPLAEAIVGSWTSPMISVTFAPDGSLAAQLPNGGNEGNWSVDASGQLHADLMGAPMVAEASVQGDALTLVIGGRQLRLVRTGG